MAPEANMPDRRFGIGFVGAGFMNRFHVMSLPGVRDADVTGIFSPNREHAESLARLAGRPYLARAAEEHSGPHMPWFWSGERQGGGVLNDMLCHSYELARFLLTSPDETRDALHVEQVNAQIASLKWTRPEYSELLRDMTQGAIDYAKTPAEDFARASMTLRTDDGPRVMIEATTPWSFVGPALRLRTELLGPE